MWDAPRSHDETGPTLADLGFTKSQSYRRQVSAEVPEEEFQEYVDTTVETEKEISSSGLYRLGDATGEI